MKSTKNKSVKLVTCITLRIVIINEYIEQNARRNCRRVFIFFLVNHPITEANSSIRYNWVYRTHAPVRLYLCLLFYFLISLLFRVIKLDFDWKDTFYVSRSSWFFILFLRKPVSKSISTVRTALKIPIWCVKCGGRLCI